ncbi:MAG: hypothetical protein R6V77_04855 [Candidatus Cloacimonadaceae bacterium]
MKSYYTVQLIVASIFILGMLFVSFIKDNWDPSGWIIVIWMIGLAVLAIWRLLKKNE